MIYKLCVVILVYWFTGIGELHGRPLYRREILALLYLHTSQLLHVTLQISVVLFTSYR